MKWTKEEREQLAKQFSNKHNEDLAKQFNRTERSIVSEAHRQGLKKTKEHLAFRKGQKAYNAYEIGTKRKRIIVAKKHKWFRWFIKTGKKTWQLYHHWVYEQNTGIKVNSKKHILVFKDGDYNNCDFKNLKLENRKTWFPARPKNPEKMLITKRNNSKSALEWLMSGSVPTIKNGYETWT
jgi:hypothetical protein